MKKNPNQLIEDVINKMFELAGHTLKYEDVVGRKDNWFQQYTMTQEQNDEWRNWGITYLRKKKRYPKHIAEREMAFIDLYCGLKIEKTENGKEQNSN